MLKKVEIIKMLNRECKEFDLRYFSLKLRENSEKEKNKLTIFVKNKH